MNILFLFSNLANAYNIFDFNQRYFWKTTPKVVLCEDAKVKSELVETAIKFWKDNSFDLDDSFVIESCDKPNKKGQIRIAGQRDLDIKKYYAFTVRDLDHSLNEISAATILIDNRQYGNLELLIHELGHALGINHSDYDTTHIMHKHVVDERTRLN